MNNSQRPTPETDALHAKQGLTHASYRDFARNLERQRDEAREELDEELHAWQKEREEGQADYAAVKRENESLREAIKEAHRVLGNALFVHQAITTYAPQDAVDKIENQKHCDSMRAALAKLQPFLKP